MPTPDPPTKMVEIFMVFLRLGLTSFGGPAAHLGYFRDEFVARRQWLTDQAYSDLVALAHFLPGPASSQVGMAIGLQQAGYAGAGAAWLGFTLPSAVALILFALGLGLFEGGGVDGALAGLNIAAIAVIAQAVWGMGRTLCPDRPRIALMAAACVLMVLYPTVWTTPLVIASAGVMGAVLFKPDTLGSPPIGRTHQASDTRPMGSWVWLALFFTLLIGLPLLEQSHPSGVLALIDAFYRSGALVFGGGHVVLPLLQSEVVTTGWVDPHTFMAGYGATQAVPGPLFTFSAFLGASVNISPSGWLGGLLCLVAVFTPSFLLIAGTLPHWERLRRNRVLRRALLGVNAGVVGLLLGSLIQATTHSNLTDPKQLAVLLLAGAALMRWKLPAWLVVSCCGLLGALVMQ